MPEPNIDVYYSSRTETLAAELCRSLITDEGSPLQSPFQRTQIIVPNSGMQRYLELKIAAQFGICSHIDMSYVGQFLWQVYQDVLGDEAPTPLEERLLTFAILNHWQDDFNVSDQRLQALLQQHKQPRQRYLLAAKIARLLRQYFNERPAMIDTWQVDKLSSTHPHESWQKTLFLQLINTLSADEVSRNILQQRFVTALASGSNNTLPSVIHVFGFHALPFAQLADLFAIGHVVQVKFYTFNPCLAYWQDVVPESVKMRVELTSVDEAELLSVGHPLLASWGHSGKYLIEQLNQYRIENRDEEISTDSDTVLTWLQQSIRHLANNKPATLKAAYTNEQNNGNLSISLHAAAGARREVEVLHDNLCKWFADSDLNPAEVLVIIPRLSDYAAHIQAVFSRSSDSISIPFSLANQTSAESDQDVQAFLSLLSVIESDFQVQILFECLHEQRIQQALGMHQTELDSLRHWFTSSRYAIHFRDNSAGHSSSLEKLLDSLLLAYVGGDDTVLANRQSAPFFYGGQQQTLNILCDLWQRFLPFAELRTRYLTLSQWLDELRHLADAFLPYRHGIDAHLNNWFESISLADKGLTYSMETVITDLESVLRSDILHGPFLSGGVSFCAVMPMRSIPAKVIAILGMNNDFPVVSHKEPLDIRQARPQWSDKNLHKEQQYFFLETLLAAREKLYLSYVGLDEQTGKALPPSALVRELFGYIERYITEFGETVTTYYSLQGFSATDSYQTLYNTPTTHERNIKAGISDIELPAQLTENQLSDALHEPLSAYWRYCLGAAVLDTLREPLAEHEFIAADNGLDRWQYRQIALATALQQQSDAEAEKTLQQQNLYAPPVITKALMAHALNDTLPLQQALLSLPLQEPLETINTLIKFSFNGRTVYFRLRAQHDTKHGLIHYHVGSSSVKKQLRAWVTHVLYHCQSDVAPNTTLLFTIDRGKISRSDFAPLSRVDAHAALTAILTLLNTVIARPYPLELCSDKRSENNSKLSYRDKVYPLYSKILTADDATVEEIQKLWSSIDAFWHK